MQPAKMIHFNQHTLWFKHFEKNIKQHICSLSRSEMCPKRCQKYMLNITVGFGDWGGAKYSIIGRNYRRMRIEKQALCIGNWRVW